MLKTHLDESSAGAAQAQATTVEILGREYRIRGVADEAYIREVAEYVDTKMREIARSSAAPGPDRVAILAAMNIADELFQARRATSEELKSIEKRAENLITLLDERLSDED